MSIFSITTVSINASTFVAVPAGGMFSSMILKPRDGTAFYVSDTEAGTLYMTIGAGSALELYTPNGYEPRGAGSTIWVKGTASSTLEVLMNG